ncbi:RING finger protein 145 isoform X2 [Syngnathus typhle]|uniref:RING finger protein 145 isoform X2 n=1 Tax=Syngnathus typhle TaxID=161592 RepID=UPI002A69CC9F|nr:RING finger protein 145 isoform X2 [Syngnathus typhle]
MPRLEVFANVALRVPSILVLDLFYKYDIVALMEQLRVKNEHVFSKYRWLICDTFYLGHLLMLVLLLLPLRHIVSVYLHVLAAMLLFVGHQIAKEFILDEIRSDHQGAPYLHAEAFNRFIRSLTSQLLVSALCAFLMKTRKVWLFWTPALPLLARLCGAPANLLPAIHVFAVTLSEVACELFLLLLLYRLTKKALSLKMEVLAFSRLPAAAISLWTEFAVPLLFSVFWVVLFVVHLCSSIMSPAASFAAHQSLLFFLLTSVSECCTTPYSLLGLTFVVSYLALGLLTFCKWFLGSHDDALNNHNVMHRGVTEGVTLLLLALQTGLLATATLQRTFLLSIIFFIVLTSTMQAMLEIAHPLVLALAASQNRSVWKHLRGLSVCLLLLVFPVFMAYEILQFFHMDFWLLILVAGCMLTSLQITGTLFIYSLFMAELFRSEPVDNLDEVIYWVNAVSRSLEFAVALCVVAYAVWESLVGEWSWTGASVIVVHSYCNVWLRARSGWRSFVLRLEAVKKINSLPRATPEQLGRHNDVCAICFMEMTSAVVTSCDHLFHANCLSKWLHVQGTCPMCHQTVPAHPPTHHGREPDTSTPLEPDAGAILEEDVDSVEEDDFGSAEDDSDENDFI